MKITKKQIKQLDLDTREIFGDNLEFSFICGSTARGEDKTNSDVDTFILLKKSNHEQEKKFLEYMKKLHYDLQKDFDHLGFCLDKECLSDLIYIANNIKDSLPSIMSSSCVLTDCILSQFQYARIILWVLHLPKIILKDSPLLHSTYKQEADKFVSTQPQWERAEPHLHTTDNKHIIATTKQNFDNEIAKGNLENTPVGIEIGKFYKPNFTETLQQCTENFKKSYHCPLTSQLVGSNIKKIIARQCIMGKHIQER